MQKPTMAFCPLLGLKWMEYVWLWLSTSEANGVTPVVRSSTRSRFQVSVFRSLSLPLSPSLSPSLSGARARGARFGDEESKVTNHVGRGPSGVVGRSERDDDDDGVDDGRTRGENGTEICPGVGLRRGESGGDARGEMRDRTRRTAVGRGVAGETLEAKSDESRPAVGATEAEFEAAARKGW